ncbi:unnamed protein product [Thelazia callipaeda]|uniref:Phosphatidylinositol 4-kinase beta n=1 Tax=Thelazia callipaeda TaxID=103827 RepID=A0A0N5CMC7_THECL|nr:unnamed protein product [Thelazia callipaeda]
MNSRPSSDCNHSKSGICARSKISSPQLKQNFSCVLQKTFNLSNDEATYATQLQRLSCNSLYSLCTDNRVKSFLPDSYTPEDSSKSVEPVDEIGKPVVDKESSTISFSLGGVSLSTSLEKGASSESLNLGPRTAGDGADDEESLTGTVTSGECVSQKSCEDEGVAFKCVAAEEQTTDGEEDIRECSNVAEAKLEIVNKSFLYFAASNRSWLLRLFESDLFDIQIAIRYLSTCKEAGVLNYLGNRLFDLPVQMVDFYISQLIVLYINIREVAEVIHPYVVKRCKDSVEFSLECCWLLDAHGVSVCRKSDRKSHGRFLRQSILNEFREADSFNESTRSVASSKWHSRSCSESSKSFVTSDLSKDDEVLRAAIINENRRCKSSQNAKVLGDLTSGGAFDNGCPCFDDERCIVASRNVMKMKCTCGALRIRPEQEFVKALIDIGNKLKNFSNKDERARCLVDELCKINVNLPARVWLPLYAHSLKHVVLRIPPLASCILNSKDKAPYCLFVEVLEVEDVRQARIPKRISDIEAAEYQRKGRNVFASASKIPSKNMPKRFNEVRTKSSEAIFVDIVKPTINLAGPSVECKEKGNTVDIRRRFSLWVKGPKHQLRDTPDDPSASAMSEPWEDKVARIKNSSPYGRHPLWRLLPVIVKTGDDLRQELLAYQLLSILQNIWVEEKVPLYLRPYKIVVCSSNSGMIEPILDASSLHQIKKNMIIRGTPSCAVPPALLTHFFETFGPPSSENFMIAQQNFVQSCAGYSLACYFLQVKDRHNGNILLDSEGHLIHIDFGYILSISPKNLGFETSPFKLTHELIDVMGGIDSDMFSYYKILLLKGLLATRKHHERILSIVEIMSNGSQLPCFRGGFNVVRSLKDRFHMNCTEEQLQILVDAMVEQSRDSITTRLYDNYQYYSNGIL